MKQITLVIILLSFSLGLFAQQRPHFTMYMLNKHKVNPAYAGFDESLSATGVYRQQWSGLVGLPEQINLNVHLPMLIIGGGVGLNLDTEKSGALNYTRADLSYSYWIDISRKVQFAVAARAGFSQLTIDGNRLRAPDGVYEPGSTINHNDPILPITSETSASPTFGIGAYFRMDKLEGGVAVENLVGNGTTFSGQSNFNYSNVRHYMAHFEYKLEIGTLFAFQPSIMLRSDLAQTELNLGILATYDERYFAGGAFRGLNSESVDAFAIIIGASLNENISLSYAYDFTLSGLASVTNGSHEIMLNYNLKKPIGKGTLPNIIYNPRF